MQLITSGGGGVGGISSLTHSFIHLFSQSFRFLSGGKCCFIVICIALIIIVVFGLLAQFYIVADCLMSVCNCNFKVL